MEPTSQTSSTTCYRHPDRVAGVTCQRCDRPICPSCMAQASVGFHCPECARGGATTVRSGRAAFGRSSDPVVTKVLIGANVAVYLLMVVLAAREGTTAMTSAAGPVFENGATFGPLIAAGDWYRLVSGAFLHSGLLHLGMNMFLLWLLGQVLEPALGRAQFALIYLVSLLGGSLGVMVLDPSAPTVGASGAVFGLMGALVVLQLRAGQSPWQSGIGTLVVLNLVITFALPGISIGGHIGGLLAGALATYGVSLTMAGTTGRSSTSSRGRAPGSTGSRATGRGGAPSPAAVQIGGLLVFGGILLAASVVVVQQQFPFLVG